MWKTVLVINLLYIISIANDVDAQGRVAPGVPPQHYQQPNQQQFQQQQQQFQHVPVQQQQHVPVQQQQHVPVQQQHVPVQQQQVHQQQVHHQVPQHQVPNPQHQQVPQQHAPHGHHGVPQPGQILNAANIVQEKEHIAEHLEVPIDTSKMTDQELQFHYFKMHDADNNNKLDGCELIKSLIHWHDPAGKETRTVLSDDSLIELVEPLFQTIDENDDGYVDYMEYKKHT